MLSLLELFHIHLFFRFFLYEEALPPEEEIRPRKRPTFVVIEPPPAIAPAPKKMNGEDLPEKVA